MQTEMTVSEFVAVCNQTLEYAYENIVLIGEVSSFKINQGKWVFFDLKDENVGINCFMTLMSLRQPLEDGMKIKVRGVPKLTNWGRFSFTVRQLAPLGEGNIKKSFELLKKKLTKEGLFAPDKKRPLPSPLEKIGVISSTQAAGYADFIKILNERWGGLQVKVCHTQVQGLSAPDQIIRALKFLNEQGTVDVIAIIRGGGSAEDLATFNDEQLVRAIAASKIPVITGIGHEVDESLADLAADVVASTPSNAAQMLTPDRAALLRTVRAEIARASSQIHSRVNLASGSVQENIRDLDQKLLTEITQVSHLARDNIQRINRRFSSEINQGRARIHDDIANISRLLNQKLDAARLKVDSNLKVLSSLNPEIVLEKGYAIIRGDVDVGKDIHLETRTQLIDATVKNITKKENL